MNGPDDDAEARLLRQVASAPPVRPPTLKGPGDTLGKYRIVRLLGRGGMGRVFLAEDTRLGRPVALKVLRSTVPDTHDRVLAEARSAARVVHPNVVTVFEVCEDPPYLAMEFVDGRTLAEYVPLGGLPVAQAEALARGVAEGLAHAHRADVLHLDLKPQNVLVNRMGTPKIVDFGISAPLGAPCLPAGTEAFMAPERLRGQASPASDVFSFGVLLHFLLTGELPSGGAAHRRVSRPLRGLVEQCTREALEARPADAAEVVHKLDQIRRRRSVVLPLAVAGALAVAAVTLAQTLHLGKAVPTTLESPAELQGPTQITHFSGTRPIWDARLSPDGNVLAGIQANGVFLQRVDGAEAITVWQHPFSFACVDWTPDGRSLVVSGTGYGTSAQNVWQVDSETGVAQPLVGVSGKCVRVSPDGRRYAAIFDKGPGWAKWPSGEEVTRIDVKGRKLFSIGLAWSPDSRHLAFATSELMRGGGASRIRVEAADVTESTSGNLPTSRTLFVDRGLDQAQGEGALTWIDDQSVLVALSELSRRPGAPGLWRIGLDASGAPESSAFVASLPAAGVSLFGLRERRLTYALFQDRTTVMVGDVKPDGLHDVRRISETDAKEWPSSWKGEDLFLVRRVAGKDGCYGQHEDDGVSHRLMPGACLWPIAAADGSLVYWQRQGDVHALVRNAPGSGTPEILWTVPNGEWIHYHHPARNSWTSACASEAPICAVAHQAKNRTDVVVFDVVSGETKTLELPPHLQCARSLSISPDGTRLTFISGEPWEPTSFATFSVDGLPLGTVPPAPGCVSQYHAQAADGELIATAVCDDRPINRLLRWGGDGEWQTLYGTDDSWLLKPVPSSDGAHIAFAVMAYDNDAWTALLPRTPHRTDAMR